MAATDPLYVLYTSGTTGKPKGIVRDNGGHAVALLWSMRHIYDIDPGDVFWAASDVGWVVGHSYIVYGPLLAGATTVLYEGKPVGTPDPGAFWRVVAEHGVKALFTAPTAIRAIRKEDPEGTLHRPLRPVVAEVSVPGRRAARPRHLRVGVGEARHPGDRPLVADRDRVGDRGQSDGGGTASAQGRLTDGADAGLRRADPARRRLAVRAGRGGRDLHRLPLPPGTLPTLWGDDARFEASYLCEHPGYYLTGDGGYFDDDGYLFVMGRIDDVINVAGHRLSTGSIEAVLASHPAVAECAVIGVADEIKGQVPRGFVVLKAGASADGLAEELVASVRDEIGAVACFRLVDVVPALPKTRSGKILRKTMRGIAARPGRAGAVDHRGPRCAGDAEADPSGVGGFPPTSSRMGTCRSIPATR